MIGSSVKYWTALGGLLGTRPVRATRRRGLLTRPLFDSGPGFGVTLGPAPELDGRWEVIGALEEGEDMLKLIEGLPYITGKSLEEPGSAPDVIFDMQKNFFVMACRSKKTLRPS